jgi:hypothetical protein
MEAPAAGRTSPGWRRGGGGRGRWTEVPTVRWRRLRQADGDSHDEDGVGHGSDDDVEGGWGLK